MPSAHGYGSTFLDMLEQAPRAAAFVGPDQRALEEMLAGFEPGSGGP